MSYTTIKAIWPGEKHEDWDQLSNSWGSAPLVWNAIAVKYLGCKPYTCMVPDRTKDIWPLWKDLAIPVEIRAVLMMTYDRAYVAKQDYARAAKDIRYFLKTMPIPEKGDNHWPWIAEFFESGPDCPGIGFHCTSVSEDPFDGPYDEEKDEPGPPDWSTIYDLYAELDGLIQENPNE